MLSLSRMGDAVALLSHAKFSPRWQMLLEGVAPNELTLAEALHSCSLAPDLPATFAVGQCVHACARELGYETDVVVGTSLINMYAKCAALPQAEAIFHLLATNARTNCVCWTAMITANAKAGEWKQAIRLYRQMQLQGIAPNRVSFVAALSACSTPEFLATGELVHSCTVERGLESDTMVANAVVSMYGKCGSVEDARKMFDGMKRRDSVTWSAMLAAIALAGELDSRARNEQALLLFARMQLEGVKPTKVTLVSLLNCCSDLAAGRMIHSRVLLDRRHDGGELEVALWNAVVNMYARCGSLDSAAREFHGAQARDFVSWNGMITASAQHSRWSDAVAYFQEMQQEGVDPDEVTMVTLLFACNHAGFVEQGCDYFASMSRDYGLSPRLEHSACVLDMLGRSGHVEVAQEMLKDSACSDPVLWTSLLGSCRVHGDLERARAASGQILDVNPASSSAYVVLYQAQTV